MSIEVNSQFTRRNSADFVLVDDGDLGGGMRSVATTAARDALPSSHLKLGMLVCVQADFSVYQLTSTSPRTWTEFGAGGGTLAASYALGASQADSTFDLDSTRLGIRVRDASTPIGSDLFAVQSNGGASDFFRVSASAVTAGGTSDNTAWSTSDGTQTTTLGAVGTAQTAAMSLVNSSAASSGAQQYSPMVEFAGQCFETTGSSSDEVKWAIQARPVQGSAASSDIVFWSSANGGAYAERISMNSSTGFMMIKIGGATGGYFTNNGSGGISSGHYLASSVLQAFVGGSAVTQTTGSIFGPISDLGLSLGTNAVQWSYTASKWYHTARGSQLTAAATITPTAGLHHVTGATTIDTIATTNVPASAAANVRLTLVADGGTITWSASGNVLSAGTISQDTAQDFVWDGTTAKWLPIQ